MILKRYYNSYLIFTLILIFLICSPIFGQKKAKFYGLLNSWKLELRTGIGNPLTTIPDTYFNHIYSANMPTSGIGPIAIFSIKKGINSHFDLGYEYDYMLIQGNGDVIHEPGNITDVLTQSYAHSFIFQYSNDFNTQFNFLVYSKIGANRIKTIPLQREFLVSWQLDNSLAGIGIGMAYNLDEKFSLTWGLEYNRIFDLKNKNYNVNNYMNLNAGIIYCFHPGLREERKKLGKKNSDWFRKN
jgi:hypothetical protein